MVIDAEPILNELFGAARAVLGALDHVTSGTDPGEADRLADAVITAKLIEAGFGVFSEESGLKAWERPVRVVVDPLDGSTNFARGVPHTAVSMWAFDDQGGIAAVVAILAPRRVFYATRGGGAFVDGRRLQVRPCSPGADMLVAGPSSLAERVWSRRLGASAVELCLVADGALDGFATPDGEQLPPWDYLAGAMIAAEAGCVITDLGGADIWEPVPRDYRRPVVASSIVGHNRLCRVAAARATDHRLTS